MQCIPTYEVVTDAVTIPPSGGTTPLFHEFRVTAPEGKVPISGGWDAQQPTTESNRYGPQAFASYPDGQDWVFRFSTAMVAGGFETTLYVVCGVI